MSLFLSYGSLLFRLYSRSTRRRAGLVERAVVIDDHTVAFLEGGEGETVLLLHGFGADKDNWTLFAKYLTGSFNVIIPDLPGFGGSSRSFDQRYDIPSQVDRIRRFADQVGLGRFHIAGSSMGGLIAGIYAANYPEQILSLGLFAPGGVADREPSRFTREMEKGVNHLIVTEAKDFDELLGFVFVKPPWMPAAVRRYLGATATQSRDFYEKVFKEASPGDQLEQVMKRISTKTLILWGDTDAVFPVSSAQVLEQGIADSEVVVVENCGHLPMFERPRKTAGRYLRFITGSSG